MPAHDRFPLGAGVTLADLEHDPHPVLARLRRHEPVSWLPVLEGWLVTRYDLALAVMRDPDTYTVDDPRFTTAQVVGPSMLSLDGAEHDRHRRPFVAPFRAREVRERFERAVREEAERLLDELADARGAELRGEGGAELRRSFAGPLAAATMARALGLEREEVPAMLGCYDAIVGAVGELTAGGEQPEGARSAFRELRHRLLGAIEDGPATTLLRAAAEPGQLGAEQVVSNAAVLLFGGIETTEGMIVNAILHLLRHDGVMQQVRAAREPAAAAPEPALLDAVIDESLRLEPAAAVVDRYATRDASLGGAAIAAGELVRVSLAAANRDPAVFDSPDEFIPGRRRGRGQLAFAHGPHVCVGVHLARLEARIALETLLHRFADLRLDPARPAEVRGLVFRKPPALHVRWD